MGKREQLIRVLLAAAETLGWRPMWADMNLEEALDSAVTWMVLSRSQARSSTGLAWLSILDTMVNVAKAGSGEDDPPAYTRPYREAPQAFDQNPEGTARLDALLGRLS